MVELYSKVRRLKSGGSCQAVSILFFDIWSLWGADSGDGGLLISASLQPEAGCTPHLVQVCR